MSRTRKIVKQGPIELVGINEQVDENEYGGSVAVTLDADVGHSGEILNVILVSTEDDSGSVQTPAGTLFFFNANPSINAGATAMTAAARLLEVGQVSIAAADWQSDANGASVSKDVAISFEQLQSLYLAWFHEDATSLNDGASDDEQLEVIFRYRRDS
jgi:hypothetical protein